jgi:hypothetical protein
METENAIENDRLKKEFVQLFFALADKTKTNMDEFQLGLYEDELKKHGYLELIQVLKKFYRGCKFFPSIEEIENEITGAPINNKQLAEALMLKVWSVASRASTFNSTEEINEAFSESKYLQNFFSLSEIRALGDSEIDNRPTLTAQIRERLVTHIQLVNQGLTIRDAELRYSGDEKQIEERKNFYLEAAKSNQPILHLVEETDTMDLPEEDIKDEVKKIVDQICTHASEVKEYESLKNFYKRFLPEKHYNAIVSTRPETNVTMKERLLVRLELIFLGFKHGIDLEWMNAQPTDIIKIEVEKATSRATVRELKRTPSILGNLAGELKDVVHKRKVGELFRTPEAE